MPNWVSSLNWKDSSVSVIQQWPMLVHNRTIHRHRKQLTCTFQWWWYSKWLPILHQIVMMIIVHSTKIPSLRQAIMLNPRRKLFEAWWRHQMETFSALLALCVGNSPVSGEFPHGCQWRGALMFSLICTWINAWVNNREAGDLRRHCAHYDVIVMEVGKVWQTSNGLYHKNIREGGGLLIRYKKQIYSNVSRGFQSHTDKKV